jgi:tetratricopeptide (TPR) repeat protein
MGRSFIAWSCVLLFAASGLAGDRKGALTVDKARLRDLLNLPTVSVQFGVGMIGIEVEQDPKPEDARKQIEKLKEQLQGNASDGQRYLELSRLYGAINEKEQTRQSGRKAVDLLRQQLANEPRNGRLHASYDEALQATLQISDALREAETAVELAPGDARCWTTLGSLHMAGMLVTLLGGRDKIDQIGKDNLQQLFAALPLRKLSAKETADAERQIAAGYRCFSKAVAMTPNDAELHRTRICWRLFEFGSRGAAILDKSKLCDCLGALAADTDQLAKVCPDDPQVHGLRASSLALKLVFSQAQIDGRSNQVITLASIPNSEDKDSFIRCSATLGELAAGKEPKVAATAAFNLSAIHVFFGDWNRVERYARQAIRLNVEKEEAWDLLDSALSERAESMIAATMASFSVAESFAPMKFASFALEKKVKRAMRESWVDCRREKLRRFPTARNHHCLAQAYYRAFQDEDALREMRTAAKLYPTDLRCQLGVAALLMIQTDAPDSLQEVNEHLARAREWGKENQDQNLWRDHVFIAAVYLGLTGDTLESRAGFESLQKQFPDDETVKKALSLFHGK